MTDDVESAWDRYSAAYQEAIRMPTDVAQYGHDTGTEEDFRLLGNLAGKRVLDLGCGGAQSSIAFAKQGAHAIGVDSSAEQLAFARRLIEEEGVMVELHHGDLADLAFVRADTIDVVYSARAFGFVADLDRVFRQVHRVLRPDGPLVFSVTHPAYRMIDENADPALLVRRSYFDRHPLEQPRGEVTFTHYPHTVADLFTSLVRANFTVDALLEPEPRSSGPRSPYWHEAFELIPRTLIMRARKVGT